MGLDMRAPFKLTVGQGTEEEPPIIICDSRRDVFSLLVTEDVKRTRRANKRVGSPREQ